MTGRGVCSKSDLAPDCRPRESGDAATGRSYCAALKRRYRLQRTAVVIGPGVCRDDDEFSSTESPANSAPPQLITESNSFSFVTALSGVVRTGRPDACATSAAAGAMLYCASAT